LLPNKYKGAEVLGGEKGPPRSNQGRAAARGLGAPEQEWGVQRTRTPGPTDTGLGLGAGSPRISTRYRSKVDGC
jgi:hypothetical protein